LPLVLATGAGANADISLGLSVLSGIIASTCLAVLFVPFFFTVLQRLDERRKRKAPAATGEITRKEVPSTGDSS
jgi:HAE1 family hydrophobic/amphiphilic exporter-1